MMILVLDVKLDSIEFSVYQLNSSSRIAFGVVENIGYGDSRITTNVRLDGRSEKHVEIKKMLDHLFGMKKIIDMLQEESIEVINDPQDISIVAHRVAHGGDYFHAPVVIDKEVKRRIKRLIPFAPHNEKSLKCIDISQKILSNSTHIAVFDTAFHQTMPSIAFKYSIPEKYYDRHGIRVYGAHGISHESVLQTTAGLLEQNMSKTSIVSISIGEECSVSAIKDGVSIDCSAGLTPTSGIIMGTNPGSVDASVIFHMLRNIGLKWKEVESVFSDNSGFGAVSGWKSLPYLINSPKVEKVDLDKAIEVLCYQLRKYVGMYLAVIGKADAIVFSGEVGVMSSRIRKQTLENMYHLGIKISAERNSLKFDEYQEISESTSVIRVFVMESNDQSFIAKSVSEMLVPDT